MGKLFLFIYLGLYPTMNLFSGGNKFIEINYKHSLRIPYNEINIMIKCEKDIFQIDVHTQQMKGKIGYEYSNREYKVFIDKNYFDNLYNKLLNIEYKEILLNSENITAADGNDIQLTIGTPQNNLKIRVWNPSYQSDSRKTNILYEIIEDIFKKIDLEEWLQESGGAEVTDIKLEGTRQTK